MPLLNENSSVMTSRQYAIAQESKKVVLSLQKLEKCYFDLAEVFIRSLVVTATATATVSLREI